MTEQRSTRERSASGDEPSSTGRIRGQSARVLKGPEIRQKLLDAAESLLQSRALNRITTNMILREAGVARGSLYHHFESSTQLLESALLQMFSRHVSLNIEMLQGAITDARDLESFLAALQRVTRISQGSDRRSSRFDRVRLIAASQNNEPLEKLLATEQSRLTAAIAEIFKSAQKKGWIRADIPADAAAVFIQSYTLGKIVDDLVPNPIDPSDWNTLINLFVQRTLVGDQEPF